MEFSINKFYTNDYYLIINYYLIAMLITYGFFAVTTYITYGFIIDVYINLFIIILSVISFFINKRQVISLSNFKKLAYFYVLIIIASDAYFSIKFRNINNIDYYFFSLITALPIIFDEEKEEKKMTSLFLLCILAIFSIHIISNESIKPVNKDLIFFKQRFFYYYHIIFSLLFVSFNFLFIVGKYKYLGNTRRNTNEIERNLIIINENFTNKEIEELIECAKINMVLFLEKFTILFPNFIKTISLNTELNSTDLYYCALIKLGLDTKEIAIVSNNSPKAVESRKYRIKKKLKLAKNLRINDFLNTL